MRIAVSSQNFRTVTGHAGTARRFIVFEADQQTPPREIDRLDMDANMAIHGFDHSAGHPLDSMNVLITGSAGESFVRHLAARGVLVVATNEINPARAVEAFLDGRVRSPSIGCTLNRKSGSKKQAHTGKGDESCNCQG